MLIIDVTLSKENEAVRQSNNACCASNNRDETKRADLEGENNPLVGVVRRATGDSCFPLVLGSTFYVRRQSQPTKAVYGLRHSFLILAEMFPSTWRSFLGPSSPKFLLLARAREATSTGTVPELWQSLESCQTKITNHSLVSY